MLDFKFTILTPWTLLSADLADELCTDQPADEFARILCERTLLELERFSFWPRARGEAFIQHSFDSFEERFLQQSEYAVIVLSGHHVSCLDNIYPRFLVFLTRRPSWRERMLLVFLGSPEKSFRFDTKILTHAPIVFHGSMDDIWESDEESWNKLLGVLRKNYLPRSLETSRNQSRSHTPMSRDPNWVSVTDLRGRPLAVKITESTNHVNPIPSSWQNLTQTDSDILTNQYTIRSANGSHVPLGQFASRVTRPGERIRTGSDSCIPFDISHGRSSSVPPVPGGIILSEYPHGSLEHWTPKTTQFSPLLRRSAGSNYFIHNCYPESENQLVIKEQEEEQAHDSVNPALAKFETTCLQAEGTTQLMCLPKTALTVRGSNHSHEKYGQTSANSSTLGTVAGSSSTENRSTFGWMRLGHKHVNSSHDIDTGAPDESGHKPMFKRLKERAHGFWKPHTNNERFGSQSKNALGGTLKSLAGFSTGILAVDPTLDTKTNKEIQARSCPNIHNARVIPTQFQSPASYLSASDYFPESAGEIRSANSFSVLHQRPHVQLLVDEFSTHTSSEAQPDKVTVQKSFEHVIPATTCLETKLNMDGNRGKSNLSYSLPTRPDSGHGSMSPLPNESNTNSEHRTDSLQDGNIKSDNHFNDAKLSSDHVQEHATEEEFTSSLPPTDVSVGEYCQNTEYSKVDTSEKAELQKYSIDEVGSVVIRQQFGMSATSEQDEKCTASLTERTDRETPIHLHNDQNLITVSDTQMTPICAPMTEKFSEKDDTGVHLISSTTNVPRTEATNQLQFLEECDQGAVPAASKYPESVLSDIGNGANASHFQSHTSQVPSDATQLTCPPLSSPKEKMSATPQSNELRSLLETDLNTDLFPEQDSIVSPITNTPYSDEMTLNLRSCTPLGSKSYQAVDETRYPESNSENLNVDINDTEASLADVPEITSMVTSEEQRQINMTDPISDMVSDISSDWNETRIRGKLSSSDVESTDHESTQHAHELLLYSEPMTSAQLSQLDSGVDGECTETLCEDSGNAVEISVVHPYAEPIVSREHSFLVGSHIPPDQSTGLSEKEEQYAIERAAENVRTQNEPPVLDADREVPNNATTDVLSESSLYEQYGRKEPQAIDTALRNHSDICTDESSGKHVTESQISSSKVEEDEPLQHEISANNLPNITFSFRNELDSKTGEGFSDPLTVHQSNGFEPLKCDVTESENREAGTLSPTYAKDELGTPLPIADEPEIDSSTSHSGQNRTVPEKTDTSDDPVHLADINKSAPLTTDGLIGGLVYENASTVANSGSHSPSLQDTEKLDLRQGENVRDEETKKNELDTNSPEKFAFEVDAPWMQLSSPQHAAQTVEAIDTGDQENTLSSRLDNNFDQKIDKASRFEADHFVTTNKSLSSDSPEEFVLSTASISKSQSESLQGAKTPDTNIAHTERDSNNNSWFGWLSRKLFGGSNSAAQNVEPIDEANSAEPQAADSLLGRTNNGDPLTSGNDYEQEHIVAQISKEQKSQAPFQTIAPLSPEQNSNFGTSCLGNTITDSSDILNNADEGLTSQNTALTQNQTMGTAPEFSNLNEDTEGLGSEIVTPETIVLTDSKNAICSSIPPGGKSDHIDNELQHPIKPTLIDKAEVDNHKLVQQEFEPKLDVEKAAKYSKEVEFDDPDHVMNQNSATMEDRLNNSINNVDDNTVHSRFTSNQKSPTFLDSSLEPSDTDGLISSTEPPMESIDQSRSESLVKLGHERLTDDPPTYSLQDDKNAMTTEQKKPSLYKQPTERDNWDHERHKESTANDQLVTMASSDERYHPSRRDLLFISSIFHFVTIYIPRHIHWFYSATFHSRERLYEVMADRGLQLAISWDRVEAGLRNPYCVTIILLGVTSTAPYWSQWPQAVRRVVHLADWYLFTPPFWVDRPILYHLGHLFHSVRRSISYHGQTVITSFRQYPWSLVNPSE